MGLVPPAFVRPVPTPPCRLKRASGLKLTPTIKNRAARDCCGSAAGGSRIRRLYGTCCGAAFVVAEDMPWMAALRCSISVQQHSQQSVHGDMMTTQIILRICITYTSSTCACIPARHWRNKKGAR